MLTPLALLVVATASYLLLSWIRRDEARGWWAERPVTRTGYGVVYPILSVALGLGALSVIAGHAPQGTVTRDIAPALMLFPMAAPFVAVAAILGLPMPAWLLPRWLRDAESRRSGRGGR